MKDSTIKLLKDRYFLEGETRWSDIALRVAEALSYNEQEKKEFYHILNNRLFIPNSPMLMNAGTSLGYYSACLVLPIEDSMKSIFDTVKKGAIVTKHGAGTGYFFSHIRPEGSPVRSTKGVASGPVSFMQAFDTATDVVKQGGKRRGANMGLLRVDHPDIEKFIACKGVPNTRNRELLESLKESGFKERQLDIIRQHLLENQLSNFNISVGITQEFMDARKKDGNLVLKDPRTNEPMDYVPAQRIWNKIVYYAWKNGEPGLVFLDKINKSHPLDATIEGVNVCVSGDNWVMTDRGARKVIDCVNRDELKIALKGKYYNSSSFFKTDHRKTVTLKTEKGYTIKATSDHKIRTVKGWKEIKDILPGEEIRLSNNRSMMWEGTGTEEEGYLLGHLIGDGWIKEKRAVLAVWEKDIGSNSVEKYIENCIEASNLTYRKDFKGFNPVKNRAHKRLRLKSLLDLAKKYGLNKNNKTITDQIEKASYDFYIGFIRGLFDTDGYVWRNGTRKAVKISQSNLDLLKRLQRMLLRLGIVSTIYENRRKAGQRNLPDGKGGSNLYNIKAQHELNISKDNFFGFAKLIGSANIKKLNDFKDAVVSSKREPYKETFVDIVKSIDENNSEDVYDVQVPTINAFDCNGIVTHNCGEQPLLPYEQCVLGAISLDKFPELKRGKMAHFKRIIKIAVRLLDNAIDTNQYPLPEIKKMAFKNRKIGLGIMGWGQHLIQADLRYGSDKSLEYAEVIASNFQKFAIQASEELAEEKEPFPNFKNSNISKPRRNAVVTNVAPTGSRSLIAETTSGIEPYFDPKGFTHTDSEGNITEISIPGAEDADPKVLVGSMDIPYWEHVDMQAAWQKYIGASISKTINFSKDASQEDISDAFQRAYDSNCKGITIYRDQSRKKQVLESNQPRKGEVGRNYQSSNTDLPRGFVKDAQDRAPAIKYKLKTGCGTMYFIPTFNENSEVMETFAEPHGGCDAWTEACSRAISIGLRSGVDVSEFIDQFKDIKCNSFVNRKDTSKGISCPSAIAYILKEYEEARKNTKEDSEDLKEFVKDNTEPSVDSKKLCPECGEGLVPESGCWTCYECGYGECD